MNQKPQVIPPQSVSEMKAQIQTIQQVMRSVMKKGEHYDTLPGCGDKNVLLKSGAEKILATFRIAPEFKIEDLSTNEECRYRVSATGKYAPDGTFLGQGVGECSSNEEKYKWRAAVCPEEFSEMPENRRRKKWKKGYSGKPNFSVEQVQTDHADQANTVLKMAVKRALVAMALIVTAASDIFTQDLEDNSESETVNAKPNPISNKQSEQKFNCSQCNIPIKQEVFDYSTKVLGKALCFNHQKELKND